MSHRYLPIYDYGYAVCLSAISDLLALIIRLSDKILIFGNGRVKDCASWEESDTLSKYVEMLVDTGRFISSRLTNGTFYVVDKEIIGNLNFTRDEKK